MLNDSGMYQGYSVEGAKDAVSTSCPTGAMAGGPMMASTIGGTLLPPVYEAMNERQIHRNIIHEVPHLWCKSETIKQTQAHIDTNELKTGSFLICIFFLSRLNPVLFNRERKLTY